MQLQRQIDDLLAQRASEWLETLRHADKNERAAFINWLSESKLHVQEFLEIAAVDRELERLDPEREEDVEALLKEIAPGVAPFTQWKRADREARLSGSKARRWKLPLTLVAGLGVMVLSILGLKEYFFDPAQSFTTEIGEQRTIELPDASVVRLNTDSEIQVELRSEERSVRLMQGEALFTVAYDPKRPFRVRSRAGVAQAVGTQFNVYDRTEGTRVSVLEGRVKVISNADGAERILAAGEEALIKLKGGIELESKGDVSHAVVWQQKRLVFDNAALEDMVREFNRYNRSLQIRLEDVPPGRHHYDGIFDATDPESLAALLAQEADLRVERKGDEIVVGRR